MIDLERILYPTDFSECSMPAAQYAFSLAQQFSAELHVLYVMESSLGKLPVSANVMPPPGEKWSGASPDELADVATRLQLEGLDNVEVHRATRQGDPQREILAHASEQNVDLIVMGTHGRIGLAHLFTGSLAESIVRKAPCPVLSVKPQSAAANSAEDGDGS